MVQVENERQTTALPILAKQECSPAVDRPLGRRVGLDDDDLRNTNTGLIQLHERFHNSPR
jgi:hypothetical protein